MNESQSAQPVLPAEAEKEMRQILVKTTGRAGNDRVNLTARQVQVLLEAHEENKGLRKIIGNMVGRLHGEAKSPEDLLALCDERWKELEELREKVGPVDDRPECPACGGKLLGEKKVCGNPVCSNYGG